MNGERIHLDAARFARNATQLNIEALEDAGREFMRLEQDPSLSPRQRQEVSRLITQLAFELCMRRRDGAA